MKNIISKNWKVYGIAILFWAALFIISAFFIDTTTGLPRINLYLFHFIMFVISVVILYFVFTWFKKKDLIENATFLTFLLVNIVLDWVLLIPFFGVTVPEWFTLVLPSYLVGTGTIYKLFK
jgi:hypothetical protein